MQYGAENILLERYCDLKQQHQSDPSCFVYLLYQLGNRKCTQKNLQENPRRFKTAF